MARRDAILAPHIGSATVETRTRMMVLAAQNVAAFFDGRTPPKALNKDALGLK
jgi:glyoxylate reductase